jgi:hypothetical protein
MMFVTSISLTDQAEESKDRAKDLDNEDPHKQTWVSGI